MFPHLASDTTLTLNVGGYLDGGNTIGRKVSYMFDLCRYSIPSFGPLNTIEIRNDGLKKVNGLSLVANNRGNWYDLPSIARELFNGTETDKERALILWKFVKENHLYWYPPDVFNTPEIEDPVKFLTTYGYGNCFMIANAAKFINAAASGDRFWIIGIDGGYHGITETRVDTNYAMIDPDRAGFYLKLNNQELASFEDILFDKYLFIRTKHFEPAYPFYSPQNFTMINYYQAGNNYRAAYTEYGTDQSNMRFGLKPGETFRMSRNTARRVQHIQSEVPDMSNVRDIIGAGAFVYAPDLSRISFRDVSQTFTNIRIDSSSGQSVIRPSVLSGSYFMLEMESPFVMDGGHLLLDWQVQNGGQMLVEFSRDQQNWQEVYAKSNDGRSQDSISIDNFVNNGANPALYKYYLRFTFQPGASTMGAAIHSFAVQTDVQVSKFFLPKLQLGANTIRLESQGGETRDLSVKIDWTEDFSHTPPPKLNAPVYPSNGAMLDNNDIVFRWEAGTATDGDSIVDYHFELSEDPQMRYPVSPNFDRYISANGEPLEPTFRSEINHFLLPGQKYYWRVRTLDSRGTWSDWSDTWNFTAGGVKSVSTPDIVTDSLKQVVLKWHSSGDGSAAVKYLIHGSNDRGFYPTVATVIDSTADSSYVLKRLDTYRYYRVASVDAQGNQSAPTAYVATGVLLDTIINEGTYDLDMNGLYQCTVSWSTENDTIVSVNGSAFQLLRPGRAALVKSYINDMGRTVFREKYWVFVNAEKAMTQAYANIASDTTISLNVGGYLDGENTVGRKVRYMYDLYRYSISSFGPLNEISVRNNGVKKVSGLSVVANNRGNWYDLPSIARELFNGTETDKERALILWKFVKENHLFWNAPDAFGSAEIEDPVKFLTTYGYGNGFMISNAVKYLNAAASGDQLWLMGIDGGYHGITETRMDTGYAMIDADRAGFYLKLDNNRLASFEDILFDKYLFLRTKHFEPAYTYTSSRNFAMIPFYQAGNNFRAAYSRYGNENGNARFSLKPGETFNMNRNTAKRIQHIQSEVPDTLNVRDIIGTGAFVFAPDLSRIPFRDVSQTFTNIRIDSSSGQSIVRPLVMTGSYFTVFMESPFVMTGGNFKLDWETFNGGKIRVDYSLDQQNWQEVYTKSNNGRSQDSINMDLLVNTGTSAARYKYYLRFTFLPGATVMDVSVRSFAVQTDVQISKFFLPRLRLGANTIRLESQGGETRDLSVKIDWTEDFSHTPPPKLNAPVYPSNGAMLDNNDIVFRWEAGTATDGDSIVDYHFELSEDPQMRYPVSPNFDRYISANGEPLEPTFRSEINHFLLPGQKYYWRVRTLDSRGTWSDWSDTWNFTAGGVKAISTPEVVADSLKQLSIQWQATGDGNAAVKYLIHGSNDRGFYPTVATVIDSTTDSSYVLKRLANYKYYRVVAVDEHGNQSAPTSYITTGILKDTLLNANTYELDVNNLYQCTVNWSSENDTIVSVNGSAFQLLRPGRAVLVKSYINDMGRTVFREKYWVFVSPSTLTASSRRMFANKPTRGVDTTVYGYHLASDDRLSISDGKQFRDADEFMAYPNPARDMLSVRYNRKGSQALRYEVFNAAGGLVYRLEGYSRQVSINVSGWTKGLYLLVATSSDGEKSTIKFLVIE